MDTAGFVDQIKNVVELTLDEIESVAGGFPIVPPNNGNGGGG